MGHTRTHTRRQAPPGAVAPESPGRGPAALRGPRAGAHELQVQVSSAVLRTVTQAETSGHTPPTQSPHMLPGGGLQHQPPTLCDSCPPLKDRKVSLPRGRCAPSALTPFAVASQESVVVRECTASPFLCLQELCAPVSYTHLTLPTM